MSVSSESGNVRPSAPTREPTSKEETPLEKIWGQMFDKDGNATPRLGQLLRGLAVHLVRHEDKSLGWTLLILAARLTITSQSIVLLSLPQNWHGSMIV